MHLLIYVIFLISWILFGIVLWYVYTHNDDYAQWTLMLMAFEFGIISQATIIISILYAVYWLFETGEIIKRDRQRIANGIEKDIELKIAYIKEDMRRLSSLRKKKAGDETPSAIDDKDRELNEFLTIDRKSFMNHLLILPK